MSDPMYRESLQQEQQPPSRQIVKAAAAMTAGGSLLILSGLTLAGTVIALVVATPLLVIFGPILVPAVISTGLLAAGFLSSGGLGIAAISVFSWIYRYLTGGEAAGAEKIDRARLKLASKAREMRERAEQQTQTAQTA